MYLTQGLHRGLQQTPDAVATISGGRTQSYRTLADRVARLAGALRALGAAPGGRVAYLGCNSDRFHEYYLGAFWAGLVVNPVNTRWSAAEIAYSLDDSGSRILFADELVLPRLDRIRADYAALDALIWVGEGAAPAGMLDYEALLAGAAPVPDARRGGDALAGLFYTGGTTGFPKGVMLTHANLVTGALGSAALRFVHPGATFLHAAPMFHLADLAAWTIISLTGGVHVTVPAFSPVAVLRAIQAHRVTDTVMVPAMLQLLVDAPELKDHDLSSLRHVGYGGSPIAEALLLRAQAALPGVTFCQAYGQTELSPITTLLLPEEHEAGSTRLRSAGRAVPHAEIAVVNEAGEPAATGEVGEIVARGGHVMAGYWNKPEETAAALRDGWMHTGDAGYLDAEGYLYVVDRVKDMIITGGENVYSAEVENALARHPAVATCAVIGLPDETWGERVHAVVVLKPGAAATADELRDHAKELIAGYKCPRSVDFAEALPISSTGKVLKRELRANYAEGA
ncbi:MAG TPA: long-chain fatty acid--CoA ligase [Allosphingosinicella sp.]|nr:long-chain fatty acid--CoA ligase [Allosphingosinicella sp.]